MIDRDLLLRNRQRQDQKADVKPRYRAVLCAQNGSRDVGSVWANENAKLVYFQFFGSGGVGIARCEKLMPELGLGVYVGKTDDNLAWQVLEDDPLLRKTATDNRNYQTVAARDFKPGGRLYLWVDSRQIDPLATYPTPNSLSVNVAGGDYPYSGTRKTFAGVLDLDLTSSVPGAGLHRYVGLYLDSANALQAVNGATTSTSNTPAEPTWPAGAFRLSVVRLRNGQTSIIFTLKNDSTNDVFDRRMMWSDEDSGGAGGGEVDNAVCDGRLTLTTSLAVPAADQLAKTTIYFTPYEGNRLALYDGADWAIHTFTERSASLAGLTVDKNHDVFIYDNAGTLTLDLVAWTNDSARATALAVQDGVYVKDGATSRRYLGTFRTTGTTGQCEDSALKRFVWNYYNRKRRSLVVQETTNSWTYTLVAWRQANASAANQVAVVIGISEEEMTLTAIGNAEKSDGGNRYTGIGHNSTTLNIAQVVGGAGTTNLLAGTAVYTVAPIVGYHYFAWLEAVQAASGTCTWYGDAGITNQIQSGMVGRTMA